VVIYVNTNVIDLSNTIVLLKLILQIGLKPNVSDWASLKANLPSWSTKRKNSRLSAILKRALEKVRRGL